MTTYEQKVLETVRRKVLKEIEHSTLTRVDLKDRVRVPPEILDMLWQSIVWSEVIEAVRPAMQDRLCRSILASMETEIKTDLKKLLSVDGVRQKIRMRVYPALMKVIDESVEQ